MRTAKRIAKAALGVLLGASIILTGLTTLLNLTNSGAQVIILLGAILGCTLAIKWSLTQ